MSFSHDIASLVITSNNPLHQIAPWWIRVPLESIAKVVNGFPFESCYFSADSGAPLIRIRDVTTGQTATYYKGPIPEGFWVEEGDLLIGMDGDFNLRVWHGPRSLLNQRVCKVIPDTRYYDPSFFALTIPAYLKLVNDHTHSITVKHLSSRTLQAIPIPFPPLPEQHRIVARIEALFARIRRVRADLKRTVLLSKLYRQRVLAQVFDDDCAGYDPVPLGTCIAAIEAGKNLQCEERLPRPGERGIVKISAVTWGQFDAKKIKTVPAGGQLDPRSRISESDFLLSRANTLELVGAPAIARGVPPETYLSDKVLRLRFREPVADWVLWFLRSPRGRREIETRSSGNQLSMRNIGQAAIRDIPIPIPNVAIRHAILTAIEKGQLASNHLEHAATRALALLDHLEQSILAKAFRGELVPQDYADKPVEELLTYMDSTSFEPLRRR